MCVNENCIYFHKSKKKPLHHFLMGREASDLSQMKHNTFICLRAKLQWKEYLTECWKLKDIHFDFDQLKMAGGDQVWKTVLKIKLQQTIFHTNDTWKRDRRMDRDEVMYLPVTEK